ncbi:hypothetical protein EVAR_29949_1 [Eumeta japonica]|uniref:Uncharacterized protein n=1 Tax=Eumeta variegata TaxID=151549 RepID=A0A4C1VF55_EUMVA|nr:hypothetical protein EVAR_29949_1 [Eumeta japonica]
MLVGGTGLKSRVFQKADITAMGQLLPDGVPMTVGHGQKSCKSYSTLSTGRSADSGAHIRFKPPITPQRGYVAIAFFLLPLLQMGKQKKNARSCRRQAFCPQHPPTARLDGRRKWGRHRLI